MSSGEASGLRVWVQYRSPWWAEPRIPPLRWASRVQTTAARLYGPNGWSGNSSENRRYTRSASAKS